MPVNDAILSNLIMKLHANIIVSILPDGWAGGASIETKSGKAKVFSQGNLSGCCRQIKRGVSDLIGNGKLIAEITGLNPVV